MFSYKILKKLDLSACASMCKNFFADFVLFCRVAFQGKL